MAEKRVSVGTTRVQILAFNAKRTAWIFHNRGTAEMFFSNDKGVSDSNGYPLPNGGFFARLKADGDDPRMAVYGIVTSGTADVGVSESFDPLPVDELIRLLEARRGT